MNDIFLCKRCLYPSSHPLKITFNEKGICSGCIIHEEKDTLDWKYRLLKLQKIIKEYKTKKNAYDCIIPVTGANDSYYTVHVAKNILKLNPLLVHYNKYYNTPIGIRNLANLRKKFDCDIYFKNINPKVIKKITQETMHMAGSVYWHCLAGHTVYPVQVARDMKIPLIIWGEHQGLQQVGMFSHKNEVEMTRRYRKDHDLMGFEPKDLIKVTNNLTMDDLHPYEYPSDKIINKIGIRGIYLGNYIRWDPIMQHNSMINKFGYLATKLNRTFDTYNYTDCFNYTNLHDFLKLRVYPLWEEREKEEEEMFNGEMDGDLTSEDDEMEEEEEDKDKQRMLSIKKMMPAPTEQLCKVEGDELDMGQGAERQHRGPTHGVSYNPTNNY